MQHRSLSLLATLVASASLFAQNPPQNTTLLANLTNGALSYASVWGYTAPDGREFAVVGAYNGTWIVETTNPSAPVTIATIPAGSTSTNNEWREMTSYGSYIYSVSEAQAGVRVIDMTNPSTPVDKGLVHSADWRNCHSIHCDPETGRIYPCGTSSGMWILDAASNPLTLPSLGKYGSGTATYVHETYCRRNKGYFAHVYVGTLRIANITNPAAITTIATLQTPFQAPITQGWTHNAWVTDDDKTMVTTGEDLNAKFGVYDITNPAAPVLKSTYFTPGYIGHDAFGIGRTIFLSYYRDGVHVLDVSNPSAPRKIAYFDSSSGAFSNEWHGCWGVYPYSDSGIVYLSDIENGLYVLRIDNGHMNRYGTGTAGTGGVPRIQFDGASPMVGAAAMELRLSKLDPNSPFALVVSGAQASVPFQNITIQVDLTNPVIVSGVADANGKATIPMPVPNDPGLGNGKIYMQVIGTSGGSLTASRGHWFGIVP